jgi:hypothetical protein
MFSSNAFSFAGKHVPGSSEITMAAGFLTQHDIGNIIYAHGKPASITNQSLIFVSLLAGILSI